MSIHIARLFNDTNKIESIELEELCVERQNCKISNYQVVGVMMCSDQMMLERKINDYIYSNKIYALRENYKKIFALNPDSYDFEKTIVKMIDNDKQWFINMFTFAICCVYKYKYYKKAVEKLIEIDSTFTQQKDEEDNTLLHHACLSFDCISNKHDYKIIKLLIPLSDCKQLNNDGNTAKQCLINARKNYISNKWKNYYNDNVDTFIEIINKL